MVLCCSVYQDTWVEQAGELGWRKGNSDLYWVPAKPHSFSELVTLHITLTTVCFCCTSSVDQLCLTLCNLMNSSMPGLPVHHQLPELTQTHVHWVDDAIKQSHPLSSSSPLALNLSQHQGLFQWVSSSHEVAKVLEFKLQHQSFQWTPRTDFL